VSIHPGQLLPLAPRLRELFHDCGYTVDGVDALLGPLATAAMGRGDSVPALAAASGDDQLSVLVRLFLLGLDVPATAAGFLPAPVHEAAGPSQVRAALELRPHQDDWWLASDIARRHPPAADHVIGLGAASATLLAATVRTEAGAALDVGTGCGIQALHLLGHCRTVTATDVLPRALGMARLSFALSGVAPEAVELLPGDMLEPVAGREFDLIVSNPPFVLGSPDPDALTYRDAGPGDSGLARLLREACAALAPGGVAQVLTSWVIERGQEWQDRPAALIPEGCDALVLLREVLDPAEHVALWRDGDEPEPGATHRSLRWLERLATDRADAVAYGLVVLRRTDEPARVRFFDLRAEAAAPSGQRIADWLERTRRHRDPGTIPGLHLQMPTSARLFEESARDADGWQVSARRVSAPGALPETVGIDPITSALLAGCDGQLSLQTLAELLSVAFGVDPAQIYRVAAHLLETGHLEASR
jgi:SAM-dependent methyltransferase